MEERQHKRARLEHPVPPDDRDGVSSFLRSWAWKREHRPDRDRFQRPYVHTLNVPSGSVGGGGNVKLTVEQARFGGAQGFASTVWDSSIVVSKMLERNPDLVSGRAVLDLSAGCGLVALVAARLGARRTVATDLRANLPLLRRNCDRNGTPVEVLEHWWGSDVSPLLRGGDDAGGGCGFDLVVACDVMYLEEAVGPLVATLAALCGGKYDSSEMTAVHPAGGAAGGSGGGSGGGGGPVVLLAHGRNRFAEAAFWRHAGAAGFGAEVVPPEDLDPVYSCSDVDVYRLRLKPPAAVAGSGAAGSAVAGVEVAQGTAGAEAAAARGAVGGEVAGKVAREGRAGQASAAGVSGERLVAEPATAGSGGEADDVRGEGRGKEGKKRMKEEGGIEGEGFQSGAGGPQGGALRAPAAAQEAADGAMGGKGTGCMVRKGSEASRRALAQTAGSSAARSRAPSGEAGRGVGAVRRGEARGKGIDEDKS